MFVMTNDGGPLPDDQVNVGPALCQRAFIFDVMARSIPIALLHGATFRDSKVADPPPPFFRGAYPSSYRLSHSSSSKDCSSIPEGSWAGRSGIVLRRPTMTLGCWSNTQTTGTLSHPWGCVERIAHHAKVFGSASRKLPKGRSTQSYSGAFDSIASHSL